jgi:hypothetical protein
MASSTDIAEDIQIDVEPLQFGSVGLEEEFFPAALHPGGCSFAEVHHDTVLRGLHRLAVAVCVEPLPVADYATTAYRDLRQEPLYKEVAALTRCLFHGLPRDRVTPSTRTSSDERRFETRYATRLQSQFREQGCVEDDRLRVHLAFPVYRTWVMEMATSIEHGFAWPGFWMSSGEVRCVCLETFCHWIRATQ